MEIAAQTSLWVLREDPGELVGKEMEQIQAARPFGDCRTFVVAFAQSGRVPCSASQAVPFSLPHLSYSDGLAFSLLGAHQLPADCREEIEDDFRFVGD